MPREREQSRLEMLYSRQHELALEAEKVKAKIAIELHERGIAHSLASLIEAKFITDYNVLHETLAAATKAYNLENFRRDVVRDNYYKTMADAAQLSIDGVAKYKKEFEQFSKRTVKQLEERELDESPKEGNDAGTDNGND